MATSSPQKTRKRREPKLKDGSRPEKYIQRDILDWLKETGLLHWRQNSGTVFMGNRMVRLGEDGLPDIVVVVPPGGRLLGLEVKSASGKLRPAQHKFREHLVSVGGAYHVVRDTNQAMTAVALTMGEEQWRRLQLSRPVSSDFGPN